MSMIFLEHRTNGVDTREFVFGIKARQTKPDSYPKRVVAAVVVIILYIISVAML